jgi:hypothetical protein
VIAAKRAFNVKATAQVQESRGREGGLAPALSGLPLFVQRLLILARFLIIAVRLERKAGHAAQRIQRAGE